MNWIRNHIAFVALALVGLLMLASLQNADSKTGLTTFEASNQQDFRSLAELGADNSGNLLDSDSLAAIVAPESQIAPAFSEPQPSAPALNDSVFLQTEVANSEPSAQPDEFSRVAQLDGIVESNFVAANTNNELERYTDLDQPELNQPELNQPELNQPELNQPELNQPEFNQDEFNLAELNQPEFNQPEPNRADQVSTFAQEAADTGSPIVTASATETKSNLRQGWQTNPFVNEDIKTVPQSTTDEGLDFFKSSGQGDPANAQPTEASPIGTAPEKAPSIVTIPANEQDQAMRTSAKAITELPGRTPIMAGISEVAAQKAVHHIEYGKSLARRNATFAARQEFYSALGVLAQSNDSNSGSNQYTTALRNAVIAFEESDEFFVTDTESQIGMEVNSITEGHRTRIIGLTQGRHMTASQALQRYMAYAGQQLEIAGGQNAVAAEALYSLGKLHGVISTQNMNPNSMDIAKSIVYHRAALGADASNFRSANELGVLLARGGKSEEAKWLLKQSLMVYQMPETWANLAKLHQRSGETRLAQLAMNEQQISQSTPSRMNPSKKIAMLNREEFILASPPDMENTEVAQVSGTEPVRNIAPRDSEEEKPKSIADRIKDWAPAIIKR